jgi:ketosteroid isomerase-like protein
LLLLGLLVAVPDSQAQASNAVAVVYQTGERSVIDSGAGSAQADDPATAFNAFNVAVNAHDVDAALALFAHDAVVQFPNQPPPNIYRGTAEIRAWLQADADQNISVQTEQIQVAGDRVTALGKADVDSLRPLGITLAGPVEAVVQDGKITSFTFMLNDETLARLQAIQTPPEALPTTGSMGRGHSWLLLAGLGLCGLGAALLRRQASAR